MAVTASGLYVATFVDVVDTTQLALDLDLETHKGALFSNSITPNFTTDTAYGVAPYNANEVTGTTVAASSGTLVFDATDVSVASTTITNARCYLLYADALAGNNAICLVDFTADYSTVNGTFSVVWAAGGIFIIDLTP